MGRVQGKVAFITGAARGQGRSHAVRLAEEGADINAVDICRNYETVGYPMATPEDLEETKNFVEKTGQRIVTAQADVRNEAELRAALEAGARLAGATDGSVRDALAVIERDESAHAELAWAFVKWCLEQGGARVRAAVTGAFEEARSKGSAASALAV